MTLDNPYPHRWAYCDVVCSSCGIVDRITVCRFQEVYSCYECKRKAVA